MERIGEKPFSEYNKDYSFFVVFFFVFVFNVKILIVSL